MSPSKTLWWEGSAILREYSFYVEQAALEELSPVTEDIQECQCPAWEHYFICVNQHMHTHAVVGLDSAQ